MDYSPLGSSVHGISQARILEWVISSSRGSSWPRYWTCISCIAGVFLTTEPPGKHPVVLYYCFILSIIGGFPGGTVVKNPPANAGYTGLIPGSGIPPGGGNGNPLQYSCLGNPMDRGAWGVATVHGVAKSPTWLSTHTHIYHRGKLHKE